MAAAIPRLLVTAHHLSSRIDHPLKPPCEEAATGWFPSDQLPSHRRTRVKKRTHIVSPCSGI